MIKHYVDGAGIYRGYSVDIDNLPFIGAVEVPSAPPSDDSIFSNGAWVTTVESVKEREVAQITATAEKKLDAVDRAVRRALVKVIETGAASVPGALLAKIKKNDLIEDTRDAAITAVNAATTKTAARAVQGAIVWP